MREYFTESSIRAIASNAGLITTILEYVMLAADPRGTAHQRHEAAATIPDDMEVHYDRMRQLHDTFKHLSNRVADNIPVR